MKSDFKQTLKNAYLKEFFLRVKNEIEDSNDQPQEVLTKFILIFFMITGLSQIMNLFF